MQRRAPGHHSSVHANPDGRRDDLRAVTGSEEGVLKALALKEKEEILEVTNKEAKSCRGG